MQRYTPLARIWMATVVAAAGIVTALAARPGPIAGRMWLTFAALGLAAAVAHFFPVYSSVQRASYRLTNVFLIAGAVILPAWLLAPLVALAVTPEAWRERRRPQRVGRWLFNIAHALLAAWAARALLTLAGGLDAADVRLLVALALAAAAYITVQSLIVGMGMALQFGVRAARREVLRAPALLTEGLFGVLGMVTVGLWLAVPPLLLLLIPLLLSAHGLTRNAHLAQLALVDPKTGLRNARGFEQALEEALRHRRQSGAPLAVLFLDLDHFKRVNDVHGHLAGDAVLDQFAALLTTTLRKGAVAARFGGEEFTVLLPETDAVAAALFADAVRETVARHPFRREDGAVIACTVSIGVAAAPDEGGDARTLLDRADQALYQAKRTRNAIRAIHPEAGIAPLTPQHGRYADGTVRGAAPPRFHPPRPSLPSLLLWATIVCGGAVIAVCLASIVRTHAWLLPLPFIALAVVTEFFPIQLYKANREKLTITLTDAVVMAMVTIQPLAAPLVNLAAALVHVLSRRQRRLDKALFNLTNPTLAAGVGAGIYLLLRPASGDFALGHLLASLAAVSGFVVVNSGVIAVMISLHSKTRFLLVVRDLCSYTPITVLLGMTGAFLGAVSHKLGWTGAAMFVVPVILMRFTLSFSARKNQEAIETLEAAKTNLEAAHAEKTKTLRQLIETVSNIIDARDNLVWGHSRNVATYAVAIGMALGLPEEELAAVHSAGLLHDLGKVAIPERILHKPGRLTDEEFAVVKEHPITGKRILAEVELLGAVATMVGDHHERFDGNGYPHRKEGEEISIGGRILSVADTLDSILSDRSYSDAKTLAVALAEIDRCAGTQFDPMVVEALHRVVAAKGESYFTNSALDVTMRKTEPAVPNVIAFPKTRVG